VRLAAATIAWGSQVAHVRVTARSFGVHHPGVPVFAAFVDGPAPGGGAVEPFTPLSLEALGVPRPEQLRFRYDRDALAYACTPSLLRYVMDLGYDAVVFLKLETLVLDRLQSVVDGLERHPVVATPHLVAPLEGSDRVARELNILLSGVYNVGVLGVRACDETRAFLGWWADRLERHCRHAPHEGMHFEQRWIDFLPAFVPGATVLRDVTVNVAHWNLRERRVTVRDARVLVDGRPVAVFRFSGFDPDRAAASRYAPHLTPDVLGEAWLVFERYRRALEDEGWTGTRGLPYAYAAFDNGVVVPQVARAMYAELGEETDRFGDPFATSGPDSYYAWLQQDAAAGAPAEPVVSRLWYWVYRRRSDLQAVYADVLGRDRAGFAGWARDHGCDEIHVPRAFLAPGMA
jgi:hypothetical protein